MNIESLTGRFIPDDTKKQAEIKAESVMIFLEDAGYKNILISFGIEHPDRVVEGEELSFLFSTKMTKKRMDCIINQSIMYRIKMHGEGP